MTAHQLIEALQKEPEYLYREVYFTLYPEVNEGAEEMQTFSVTDVTFHDDGSSPFAADCKPDYVELSCYE